MQFVKERNSFSMNFSCLYTEDFSQCLLLILDSPLRPKQVVCLKKITKFHKVGCDWRCTYYLPYKCHTRTATIVYLPINKSPRYIREQKNTKLRHMCWNLTSSTMTITCVQLLHKSSKRSWVSIKQRCLKLPLGNRYTNFLHSSS